MHVLSAGVPFSQIQTILIENMWLSTRNLDYFMGQRGYEKFHQLAIDAVYTRRKHLWLPPDWNQHWTLNKRLRDRKDIRKKICAITH